MKELDPLLHSQLRLSVMSLLLSVEEADFVWLKEKTEATSGNLSVQIDKLAREKTAYNMLHDRERPSGYGRVYQHSERIPPYLSDGRRPGMP